METQRAMDKNVGNADLWVMGITTCNGGKRETHSNVEKLRRIKLLGVVLRKQNSMVPKNDSRWKCDAESVRANNSKYGKLEKFMFYCVVI